MARTVSLDLLNSLTIASPCTADWDAMTGDDRARFCGECRLHVYNLSGMTADDAAALIQSNEGRLCVRLYKRADGTVITQDCPVGLRLIRQKLGRALGRIAAASAFLLAAGASLATGSREDRRLRSLQPFAALRALLSPTPATPIMGGIPAPIMGKIACPPPPTTQPAAADSATND